MGDNKKHLTSGFTIIEVMLFLSISSLLFVGMVGAWRRSVDTHRYNDIVNTLKSDIQQVFSNVENPVNLTERKIECTADSQSVRLSIQSDESRKGASNCVILGKFIRILPNDSGEFTKNIRVSDVIGLDIDLKRDCPRGQCYTSIDALKATKFVIADGNDENSAAEVGQAAVGNNIGTGRSISPEWKGFVRSATFNGQVSPGRRAFTDSLDEIVFRSAGRFLTGILILRSPLDGSVMSFAMPLTVDKPGFGGVIADRWLPTRIIENQTLIGNNKKVYLCVAPNSSGRPAAFGSVFGIGGKNKIIAVSGTSSSVEVLPYDGDSASWCDSRAGSGARIFINGVRLNV